MGKSQRTITSIQGSKCFIAEFCCSKHLQHDNFTKCICKNICFRNIFKFVILIHLIVLLKKFLHFLIQCCILYILIEVYVFGLHWESHSVALFFVIIRNFHTCFLITLQPNYMKILLQLYCHVCRTHHSVHR